MKNLRPDEGIPAWAFRFLQSIPGVTMILSGMSNFEQMQDNIHTFESDKPLSEEEMKTLGIADKMPEKKKHTVQPAITVSATVRRELTFRL